MILNFNDESIISRILPLHCTSYLESKGWIEIDRDCHRSTVWQKSVNEKDEYVLLPMDTDLKDYIARIVDLVDTLKRLEGRALECIVADLLQSNSDTFRIIAYKDRPEYSLPLINASTMIRRSLDMIAAAAHSISSQKAYYVSRHPKEVEDFLSKVRLGHTERGSFIVSMHVPVQPRIRDIFTYADVSEEMLIVESDEPFERRVMMQLARLTNIAINAANSRDFKQFADAIPSGLSANFCEALSDIVKVSGDDGAHFDLNWAPTRSINKSWGIRTRFNIRPDTADALESAGKELRRNEPEPNVGICGYVVRLEKNNNDESGIVKIIDTLSEAPRSLYLELNEAQYNMAIDAHKQGKLINIIGDIQRQGKKSIVKSIHSFETLEDEEYL